MKNLFADVPRDPNVLVGFGTLDDAGVYRLDAQTALVQTVDFITPVVDDPFAYGEIAVANALSDVYAMGGLPKTALNVVCFPSGLDPQILNAILRGGLSKLGEAGVALMGGHTVDDPEIKFGLSVTGTVHPDLVWTNAGARVGDVLVLTKPLGIGAITTGIKQGVAGGRSRRRCPHLHAKAEPGCARRRGNRRPPRLHRRHRLQPHGPSVSDAPRVRRHRPCIRRNGCLSYLAH